MVSVLREGSVAKIAVGLVPILGNQLFPELAKPLFAQSNEKQARDAAESFFDSRAREILTNAIERQDRSELGRLARAWSQVLPKETAEALLSSLRSMPEKARDAGKRLDELAKRKSGPHPGLRPNQYDKLAARGTQLVPVVLKVLDSRASKSKKSTQDVLKFHETDFPEPCKYLLLHIKQFELALNDEWLRSRGKKPSTRALAIADAVAGAEHDYDLRPSYERARQGRRAIKRPTP